MATISYRQTPNSSEDRKPNFLNPLRCWINGIEVKNCQFARSVCRLIPGQCPFEREVKVFGRTLIRIPPLCKLNPLYDELIGLRLRALSYLAEVSGEEVTKYLG